MSARKSPPYTDFATLVKYLVETREEGVAYRMAKRVGMSSATIYMWRDGVVKVPKWPVVWKLCDQYKLDRRKVVAMLTGTSPGEISGGSGLPAPLPVVDGIDVTGVLPLIRHWCARSAHDLVASFWSPTILAHAQ